MSNLAYDLLAENLEKQGIQIETLKSHLKAQHIETPSWGYGNSGTRFGVFEQPGAARNAAERLEDAATVHRFTGVAPTVALHIPWDKTDDWGALKQYAADVGIGIGAINPNVFQDQAYKLGSVCNPDAAIRRLPPLTTCLNALTSWGKLAPIYSVCGSQMALTSRGSRISESASGGCRKR